MHLADVLWNHSLALKQATPLPCVRSTENVIWRRKFMVVGIGWLLALLPKDNSLNSLKWDARQYAEDWPVATSEGNIWNIKCISLTTTIIPDILLTFHLCILQHLTEFVTCFLNQHSRIEIFNQLWAMIPSYHGFDRFNNSYSQVTQSSGKEMEALGTWLLQCLWRLF